MLLLLRLEKFASLRWREFFWKIKKWSTIIEVAIGIPATEFRFFFLLHTPSRRNYGFPPETAYAGTRQAESWFLLYPAEKPCFFDKK